MKVGYRQKLGLAVFDPLCAGQGLAFGAMPIPAGVEAVALMARSRRSRWPPKAAVRHTSMAVMTRRCAVATFRREGFAGIAVLCLCFLFAVGTTAQQPEIAEVVNNSKPTFTTFEVSGAGPGFEQGRTSKRIQARRRYRRPMTSKKYYSKEVARRAGVRPAMADL